MAMTISEMMVSIGVDVSDFQKGMKEVAKNFEKTGASVKEMAREMGQKVQGFGDKWGAMSSEMKEAYQKSKAALQPFKRDIAEVEYSYFKLAEGMKGYSGTSADFLKEVAAIGKRHKTVTDEMVKNNDFMKKSFLQTVGTILNRSGQSEKIADNFERMGNPLYTVNNGLLKITSSLEGVARQGNASVLALKLLGPTANMKALRDMTMMINQGLMRFQMVAMGALVANALLINGLHKAASSTVPGYQAAFDKMGASVREAFQPMVEVFGAVMKRVYEVITVFANLAIKFNEAHPILAKVIQGFLLLIPVLTLLLSPLAIGIGLIAGMQAAFASVWMLIGPLITGLGAMMGTVLLVAGAIAVVGVALWALWTRTSWFKDAVLAAWEAIKQGALYIWNAIYNNAIKPVVEAIVSFVTVQLNAIKKFWNQNGSELLGLAKNYFSAIRAYIEMVMGIIKGVFQIAWPIISGIVKVAWGIIKTTTKNFLDIILGVIKVGMKLINGDWSGAWKAIEEIGRNIMNNITSFFEDIDLWQIGKDIIQGLINGIGSMVGSVSKKVKEIASLVPKGVKDLLDINSPSRVMMELGGYTGEGFVDGLLDKVGSIKNAVGDMTSASIHGIKSDNPTLDQSNNGNTYNFYPQKAIMDEKEVVRSIQRLEVLYG